MQNTNIKLNKTDIKILEILQKEGRLSVVELAKRVNLTTTPCAERLRRLEKSGVINNYSANINAKAIGLEMSVFIHIRLDQSNMSVFEEFGEAIQAIPDIEECFFLTGSFDALIKIHVADMQSYRQFMRKKLNKIPGIIQTQSEVVIERVKASYGINPELIETS